VDEVQDIDAVQYEILCRVAGDSCRVSCVGDPRQAIYGFRGAVKSFFETWKTRFSVPDDGQRELLFNYRSVSQVVEVGNLVAAGYAGNCSSTKGKGMFPVSIHYAAHVEDMNHKALHIIQSITSSASARGLTFSDIGVVTRKSATGRELQRFLQQHRVPCRTLRRRDPTAAVMMRGLLAHLRCLIDPYASNVDVMEALEYPEKLSKSTKTGLISGRKCREEKLRSEATHQASATALRVSYFELIDELVQNQFMVPDAQLIPRTRKDRDALSRWHEAVVQLHHELRRLSIPQDVLQYSSQKASQLDGVKQEEGEMSMKMKGDDVAPLKHLISRALETFGFTTAAARDEAVVVAADSHASLAAPPVLEIIDDGDEDEVDPLISSNDGLRDLLFEALDNLHASGEPHEGVSGLCALVDSLQPLDGAVSDYGPVQGSSALSHAHHSSTLPSALQRQKSLQENRLTISTVHKAKGLEWPVVIVFDCTEGEMPIVNKYDNTCHEEEKRIFYVAVSRAMEQLVIFAQESAGRLPSRFLKCLQGHVEEVRRVDAQATDAEC
jgi:superfamily I DNA/RNA helicase